MVAPLQSQGTRVSLDAKEIINVANAARELGHDPLRLLGSLVALSAGLAGSGDELAEITGKTANAATRTLRQLRGVLALVPEVRQAHAAPPDPKCVKRTPDVRYAHEFRDRRGGLGGSSVGQNYSANSDSDSDGADAAFGGGGSQEPRVSRPINRAAFCVAYVTLEAIGLSESVRRQGMAHVTNRWRRYGHKIRQSDTGYCRTVAETWAVERGHATQAMVAASRLRATKAAARDVQLPIWAERALRGGQASPSTTGEAAAPPPEPTGASGGNDPCTSCRGVREPVRGRWVCTRCGIDYGPLI